MDFQIGKNIAAYKIEKDEKYMGKLQRKHFKKILLGWKSSITEQNQLAKQQLQNDTSPMADITDRASLEEEFALTLKSRDRERKLVNKIDAALERISAKDFGYCENCGEPIGIRRLEARPTAELCIDCKELEEKREKSRN